MSIKSFVISQKENKKSTTSNCWSQLREINVALDSVSTYKLSHKHSKEQAEHDSEMIMLFVPVKTQQKLHALHSMQQGDAATCHSKQCPGTAGSCGIWGKQRGCVGQFISKGKERVCAIIITVKLWIHSYMERTECWWDFFGCWKNVNDTIQEAWRNRNGYQAEQVDSTSGRLSWKDAAKFHNEKVWTWAPGKEIL